MRIEEWMDIGRDRRIPAPIDPPEGLRFDLGAGFRSPSGSFPLDLPTWDAMKDPIPCEDGEASLIWMNGFLDHVPDPRKILRESERALMTGGVINIVIPHGMSELSAADINKHTRWTEKSFRNLLGHPRYTSGGEDIGLVVHTQFILGVVWRNLSLFTQLVKP